MEYSILKLKDKINMKDVACETEAQESANDQLKLGRCPVHHDKMYQEHETPNQCWHFGATLAARLYVCHRRHSDSRGLSDATWQRRHLL